MPDYIFSNLIGTFVFDKNFKVKDSILFKDMRDYEDKKQSEGKLIKKYNDLKKPNNIELKTILIYFKNKKYFPDFYNKNLELTKKQIKESVNEDLFIIQAINSIDDLTKIINILTKRLRDWYELYNPEFSNSIFNNEKFVELILKKSKKELLKEINVKEENSMGSSLSKEDLDPILKLGKQVEILSNNKENNEEYLEKVMKKYCPNLNEVAGSLIGARLLGQAGSLKRLVLMPASTIQVLGAEKALFRHLKSKKKIRPPKFGFISQHPIFEKIKREDYGKAARNIADKLSIAVKIDYFKGKFIGDKLRKELESKFKK